MVTMDVGIKLSSTRKLSMEDLAPSLDPMLRANFTKMFTNIMKEDKSVWTTIHFLTKCKTEITGFDYRIQYGSDGKPTAVMYMTPRMRYNLIRYSNIMFLDSQKRQYNRLGWPYIGPVVRTNENKTAVTAEAIVTSENVDTYVWVLKAMQSIEPRWKFSNLMIIYVDGLISDRLLKDLGISDSCILHDDFFHLYKENWPKPHNFGIKCFNVIKEYLKAMLLSKNRSEWDLAYQYAKLKLNHYPKN